MDNFLVRSIVHGRHNEFQVFINTVDSFSDPECFDFDLGILWPWKYTKKIFGDFWMVDVKRFRKIRKPGMGAIVGYSKIPTWKIEVVLGTKSKKLLDFKKFNRLFFIGAP